MVPPAQVLLTASRKLPAPVSLELVTACDGWHMSTGVTVGSLAPGKSWSSVKTSLKFEPETVPWVLTCVTAIGELIVTWKTTVTLLPIGSVSRVWSMVGGGGGIAAAESFKFSVFSFALRAWFDL